MNNTGSIAVRQVREERRGDAPLFVHPEWIEYFPWLVHGTTTRDAGNFSSFGVQTAEVIHRQWKNLRDWTGARTAVMGRQVHGAHILQHQALSPGLLLAEESDGHITAARSVLLAVSIADCVPVFMVDSKHKRVAALHAGWRGTAAGILRRCLEVMGNDVHVHLGPSICGACYEVGPEVHEQLGLQVPAGNTAVDLRAVLAAQCIESGVEHQNVTTSAWCTRCDDGPFFSHRSGHPERQVGVIAIR